MTQSLRVLARRAVPIGLIAVLMGGCSGLDAAPSPTAAPPAVPTQSEPTAPPSTPTAAPTATHTQVPTATTTSTPNVFAEDFLLGDATYRLPLTIRHVSPTSAVLLFELDQPLAGSLFYQVVGGYEGGEIPFGADATRHQLTVQDLTPGNTYRLRVGIQSGGSGWVEPGFLGRRWGPVTVHTMAENQVFRFGVIGDASFGDQVTKALIEQMAGSELDFVLHAGDVVDETASNADPFESYAHKYYETFELLLRQLPVYTVPGNHDYDADIRWQGAPFYYYAFPPFDDARIEGSGTSQYYAFAQGGLQYIMLDSQVLFGVAGRQSEQEWLAERLADDRFQASIPVLHVSPYSSSAVHRGETDRVRQSWAPLFEGAGVPVVFSGHTQDYERLTAGGTTYIVSGGGSAITYAGGELRPESQLFARKSHFVLVEVYADRLELTSFDVAGEVIDQAVVLLP